MVERMIFLAFLFVNNFASGQTNADFQPGKLWYDNNKQVINAHGGGITFVKGKYYWFGEHKVEGTIGNTAQIGVHCYSSSDLYNWKDEGISLSVSSNPDDKLAKGCIIERPKVIFNKKTNKFVMWFHYEPKGVGYKSAQSGVAVSDKITGPYALVNTLRPDKSAWPVNVLPLHIKNKFTRYDLKFKGGSLPEHADSLNLLGRDFKDGQMARDMTLFVDDDGKAYHIYASEENSTMHISQLTNDYLSHAGKYSRVFVSEFREAPAILKRNGKYYLVTSGCTGWNPNAGGYAVANSILGEWRKIGNPCVGPGSDSTFNSQGTYILPVQGKKDAYVFMADRWNPTNAIDGRYIWLPITFDKDKLRINWEEKWSLKKYYR